MKEEEERKISSSGAKKPVTDWFIHQMQLSAPLNFRERVLNFMQNTPIMPDVPEEPEEVNPSCKLHFTALRPSLGEFRNNYLRLQDLDFCKRKYPFLLSFCDHSIDLSLPGRYAGHGEQREKRAPWRALRRETALLGCQCSGSRATAQAPGHAMSELAFGDSRDNFFGYQICYSPIATDARCTGQAS